MRTLTLTLLLAACGPKAPPPIASAPAAVQALAPEGPTELLEAQANAVELAPFPFTAEQIREGCPLGRSILLKVTLAGEVRWQRMTFVEVDEEGAVIEGVEWADGEEPGPVEAGRSSWVELRDHASFPADTTELVANKLVEVPLGSFSTSLYKTARDGKVDQLFFAAELPGPPVRMVFQTPVGEGLMEMVENKFPE